MSCGSSFSFMNTASRSSGAEGAEASRVVRPQERDDRCDRIGRIVSRGHGHHPLLVWLGRLEGIELGAEQLRGEEVTVPGGEPPGYHLAIHGQEDHPRL